MATYNSDDIVNAVQPVDPGFASNAYYRTFRFTFSNTSLTTADKINLVPLNGSAGGSTLLDYFMELPVLDTGTTMTWSLGDTAASTTSTTYISGTTAARTATGPAVATPVGIAWNTSSANAPAFVAGTQRQVLPKNYAPVTAGNTTTGGINPVYLLFSVLTGSTSVVTTGIKITGWVELQDYGNTPLT